MLLGGLVKNSTLDYPGALSAVVFARGCDFHCPYCHNPSLLAPDAGPGDPPAPDVGEVLAFLRRRRGLIDAVVVSGGEPAFQGAKALGRFLASVKALGYPVKLDTNGSRPEVLAALIKAGLVDRLAVDVKAVPGRYPAALCAAGSAEGVGLTAAIAIELHRAGRLIAEFRTTCYAPVVDEGVIMEIARVLSGPVPWYLQACRPERVLSPKALAAAGPQPGKEVLAGWAAAASSLLPCSVR